MLLGVILNMSVFLLWLSGDSLIRTTDRDLSIHHQEHEEILQHPLCEETGLHLTTVFIQPGLAEELLLSHRSLRLGLPGLVYSIITSSQTKTRLPPLTYSKTVLFVSAVQ